MLGATLKDLFRNLTGDETPAYLPGDPRGNTAYTLVEWSKIPGFDAELHTRPSYSLKFEDKAGVPTIVYYQKREPTTHQAPAIIAM